MGYMPFWKHAYIVKSLPVDILRHQPQRDIITISLRLWNFVYVWEKTKSKAILLSCWMLEPKRMLYHNCRCHFIVQWITVVLCWPFIEPIAQELFENQNQKCLKLSKLSDTLKLDALFVVQHTSMTLLLERCAAEKRRRKDRNACISWRLAVLLHTGGSALVCSRLIVIIVSKSKSREIEIAIFSLWGRFLHFLEQCLNYILESMQYAWSTILFIIVTHT